MPRSNKHTNDSASLQAAPAAAERTSLTPGDSQKLARPPGSKEEDFPAVPTDPLAKLDQMIWWARMLADRTSQLNEAVDRAMALAHRARGLSKQAAATRSVAEAKRLEAKAEQLNVLVNSTLERVKRAAAPLRPYWVRACEFVNQEYLDVDPGLDLINRGFWNDGPSPEVSDWLEAVHGSLARHRTSWKWESRQPGHVRIAVAAATARPSPGALEMPTDLISQEDAAEVIGVCSKSIRKYIERGKLTPHGPMRRLSKAECIERRDTIRERKPRRKRKNS